MASLQVSYKVGTGVPCGPILAYSKFYGDNQMPNSLNPIPAKSADSSQNSTADVKSVPFTLSVRGFNKLIALINQFDSFERTNIDLITGCALATSRLINQPVILKQDTRFIARIFPNSHIEWQAYTSDISEQFNEIIAESIADHFTEIINPKPVIKVDDNSLESAMNELFSI